MREINEQWIENGRMYKAVLQESKIINRVIDGNICHGCCHVDNWDDDCLHPSKLCPLDKGLIVKDLGPVNEDGFLRDERSGQYPDIRHDKRNGVYEAYLHATLINPAMSAVLVRVQASSMDRLKDAWNRRAV